MSLALGTQAIALTTLTGTIGYLLYVRTALPIVQKWHKMHTEIHVTDDDPRFLTFIGKALEVALSKET